MLPLKDDNPTHSFPIVTIILIVLNLAVFGYQLSLSNSEATSPQLARAGVSERDQLSLEYGAIPQRVTDFGDECDVVTTDGESLIACAGLKGMDGLESADQRAGLELAPWWLSLITSMFLHGGLLHLAGNMLFLWVFGNNIEDSMGPGRFIAFYLLGGLAAVYGQALLEPSSTTPVIGASGAIAGILGGYALLHPHSRVLTMALIPPFVGFIWVPAALMLAVWFGLQFLPAVDQFFDPDLTGGGGIAYYAHVGGFVFGLAMIKLFARRESRDPDELPSGTIW